MNLMLTVPFPCFLHRHAADLNDIDEIKCPLSVELAVPEVSGEVCQSRLTGTMYCGIDINPKRWNDTHAINIIHQDTLNYHLTTDAEMKMYLKTYDFRISKIWSHLLLPVVNVNTISYIKIVNQDKIVTNKTNTYKELNLSVKGTHR